MSLPIFPNQENTPTREEAINQILSSIAMEELGLSHIINAEGERLQYALGTIPGISGPDEPLTMEQLMELNESVHKSLDRTMMNQFFLKEKMLTALSTSIMQGPTGPTGPQGPTTIAVAPEVTRLEPEDAPTVQNIGPSDQEVVLQFGIPRGATGAAGASILGSYNNIYELIDDHPTGTEGDAYLVGNSLYVWSVDAGTWQDMGSLAGPTGATGAAGAAILGSYDDAFAFIVDHPTGTQGDAYLVEGNLYVWGGTPASWQDMGRLVGPTGPTGAAGATILDSYDDYVQFITTHTTGTPGDAYLVGGDLYVWSEDTNRWENMGTLVGPAGAGIEILGSYDTLAQLVAEHPDGQSGEVYAVDGVLHYWNDQTSEWTAIENLSGPTGPTGPTGPGLEILGTYDTIDELQQAHPSGEPGELYVVGSVLYYWNEDTSDWEPIDNLQGPTGPTGPAGAGLEILGSYATIDQLEAAHPTGAPGEIYAVDGILYYWNEQTSLWEAIENLYGPTGPTGATGPTGPESSSYTIIPFASHMAPKTYATNGAATRVTLLGFGYFDTSNNALFSPEQPVTLESDGSFVLGANNRNRQLVFSVPYPAKIRSIYATVGNALTFDPSGTVYPYIQLYQASAESNVFFPIPNARAEPVTGLGPGNVPEAVARAAFVDGLDIDVPAGARIGIGGLMRITGDTGTREYYLYFTGGIGMSRSV